jgi:hypothetical protein
MLKASSSLSNFSPEHSSRTAFLITTSRHHQPLTVGLGIFRESLWGGFRGVTLDAEDVVLEPDATTFAAAGGAFALEELIWGSDGLMVTLVCRAEVEEVEDWDTVLRSGFEVVEVVRTLCAPFDAVLTFGACRWVAFKAACRVSSRYLRVASRKAVLCDVLAHGYIGNI